MMETIPAYEEVVEKRDDLLHNHCRFCYPQVDIGEWVFTKCGEHSQVTNVVPGRADCILCREMKCPNHKT